MTTELTAVSTTLMTLLAYWVCSRLFAKVRYYLGLPYKVSQLERDLDYAKRRTESEKTFNKAYRDSLDTAREELEAAKAKLGIAAKKRKK